METIRYRIATVITGIHHYTCIYRKISDMPQNLKNNAFFYRNIKLDVMRILRKAYENHHVDRY